MANKKTELGFWTLFLALFIDLLGFGIVIPILPFFVQELGGSNIDIGWIFAIYSLAQLIFAPIWGRLSDRIGRKPIIIVGLLGSGIGFAIFGFGLSVSHLYIARIIAGVFTSATLPTSRAYVADSFPAEERGTKFAYLGIAMGIGFASGPGLGVLLTNIEITGLTQYAAPSFFASFLSLINFLFVIFLLEESLDFEKISFKNRINILETLQYATTHKEILALILIIGILNLVMSSYEATFAIYSNARNPLIMKEELGIIFTVGGAVLISIQALMIGPLIDRFGDRTVMILGLIIMMIGFLFTTLSPAFVMITIAAIITVAGYAIANPTSNSLLSSKTDPSIQGSIMGITSSFASFMRVLGPIGGAYSLDKIELSSPFILSALVCGIGTIMVLYLTSSKLKPFTLKLGDEIHDPA